MALALNQNELMENDNLDNIIWSKASQGKRTIWYLTFDIGHIDQS